MCFGYQYTPVKGPEDLEMKVIDTLTSLGSVSDPGIVFPTTLSSSEGWNRRPLKCDEDVKVAGQFPELSFVSLRSAHYKGEQESCMEKSVLYIHLPATQT